MKFKNQFLVEILHITVLFNFAVAQPLYGLLSRNSVFFIAEHAKPIDIIFLVISLSFLLPLIAVCLILLTRLLGRKVYVLAYSLGMTILAAMIALPILKKIEAVSSRVLIVSAIVIGLIWSLSYLRLRFVKMFLNFLIPVIFIFPFVFLTHPQISRLIVKHPEFKDSVEAKARVPIVMVLFDELPLTSLLDDKANIDVVRYPNFAALAEYSYWFKNATASADSTMWAVPPVLTGRYPRGEKLPTAYDYPQNLFTLLGSSYQMQVTESHTMLCPEELCSNDERQMHFMPRFSALFSDVAAVYLNIIFPEDFFEGIPVISQTWKDFWGDQSVETQVPGIKDVRNRALSYYQDRPAIFEQFVKSIHATEKPTLFFLHILLPHVPWLYFPSGKKYAKKANMMPGWIQKREKWSANESLVNQAYQRHLLQVSLVDRLLGNLLTQLKTTGLFDQSLIVIASDHGVSFIPDDRRRHVTDANLQNIASVPLFIKIPHQKEGVVSDRNVENIDILPTIADVIDYPLPSPVDGQSAFDLSIPERKEKNVFTKIGRKNIIFHSSIDLKSESLQRKLKIFGSDSSNLFKFGLHSEIIGWSVNQLAVDAPSEIAVDIDQSKFLVNVDLNSDLIPALLSGHVYAKNLLSLPVYFAVAVNGTIQAVTEAYSDEGDMKYMTIIPEDSFQNGKNEIQFFLLEMHDQNLFFHPITLTGER